MELCRELYLSTYIDEGKELESVVEITSAASLIAESDIVLGNLRSILLDIVNEAILKALDQCPCIVCIAVDGRMLANVVVRCSKTGRHLPIKITVVIYSKRIDTLQELANCISVASEAIAIPITPRFLEDESEIARAAPVAIVRKGREIIASIYGEERKYVIEGSTLVAEEARDVCTPINV